ncbi:FAD binding domain protein [Aspergillus homomorphus CBS 101889]|uniref:FAD binding domain protein n=1 Tax=Aspergillus homomorphus (strain CBS 101889) TaxID=1450537 RepID=A0A395HVR2_ASPHC|nr:FAD binding domain protein [Aspergillus homomorphus CBS 101889]RAL10928.1 FAD binding domain protein [Aspergillus homomorphus CBS 101889]
MANDHSYTDLLIIGAGPAGLMAACWAAQFHMKTRIIDQKSGRTPTGHADGLQSRTLEILDSFGIVDPILRKGVPHTEMAYWALNESTGRIERLKTSASLPGSSVYDQYLLNQGATEQVLLDSLNESGVKVEYGCRAENLTVSDSESETDYKVAVEVASAKAPDGTDGLQDRKTIRARYLIACDGARGWTRNQLNVPVDKNLGESTWAVFDIAPITDFPDIRQSCAISSGDRGSIMTAPRENRLVRFYIHPKGDRELCDDKNSSSNQTLEELVRTAESLMAPYQLRYKYCDWWSMYSIKQQLVKHLRPHNRIFLAGDAAHTHSPKAGQGMNVSMQDTYNLVWKLGAVITGVADPKILDTYESERGPVAAELLRLDVDLVGAYEKDTGASNGVESVRDQYSEFISGLGVTYSSNALISDQSPKGPAKNIRVGRRLDPFSVVNHAEGNSTYLTSRLRSDGSWRLLVFAGDLRQADSRFRLDSFAQSFSKRPFLLRMHRERYGSRDGWLLETILIHASPRTAVELLDLPEIFHPFDDTWGWDYTRVFADNGSGQGRGGAYEGYGVDTETGCVVLCRPDQHVAWIGDMDQTADLDSYFSSFVRDGSRETNGVALAS